MTAKPCFRAGLIKTLLCVCCFLAASSHPDKAALAAPNDDIDLFFVIDNSGSMRKNDPNFMTPKTVRAFLRRLSSTTRVGMVMFDQKARLLEPLLPLADSSAQQRLTQSLDAIDYRGKFTNSAAGIERALYELKSAGRPEAQRCIIFLTDGIVDTGRQKKDAELTQWLKHDLTAESRSQGIRIFGIAFTENADFILIQALSQRTAGAYYRAYNPEDIADVLDQIQTQLEPPPAPEQPAPRDPVQPSDAAPSTAPLTSPAAMDIETPDTVDEPAVQTSDKGFIKFYLPLVLIIFLLIGLLVFLIFKVFRWPLGVGGQRLAKKQPTGLSPMEAQLPEWQLHDLGKPGNPATHFSKLKITIGRDVKNDLVIAEATVSNFHATIAYRDDAFFLEDQRSTNGTRLNDHKVAAGQPIRLKSGDRIQFANHEFKFVRLDQLISGDTVMLSVTALPSEPQKQRSPSATLRADDEKHLLESLEHHLAQIRALGAKYDAFVTEHFSKETTRTLSVQAQENMQQTMADGDQHCSTLVKNQAFYVVCTLPVPIARTAEWFGERYGGFTQFIFKWIRSDAYDVTASDVFCVVTFGLDQGHWVSMTIVPTHEASGAVEIMSVDFLTDAEKASLALDFDDHGRVL